MGIGHPMWVGWCIIIAMRSIPASVESSVLRWARESCGLTEVAAARKLGLPDDRVAAWEVGEVVPTIAQLRKRRGLQALAGGVLPVRAARGV